jgi:hypothetical protein
VIVSSGGVRSIWLRHGLERFRKRLALLEEKAAKEGIVYIETKLVALEAAPKAPVTAADLLNDRVLPFFEHYDVPVLRVLTDRGTEYCGTGARRPTGSTTR